MSDAKSVDYLTEMENIMAFLMNFSLEAYQFIENEDSDGFLDVLMSHAEEIYQYKQGKPLQTTNFEHEKPLKGGWRVL